MSITWKASLFATIAVALAACGKSKADQCSKVIAAYNEVGETMRKGIGDGTDPAAVEANATAIDVATKAFVAVDVSDAKLKTVRDDLAAVFTKHVANLKTMAAGLRDTKDPAKADAAIKRINEIAAQVQAEQPAMVAAKQALMAECNATAK